MLYENIEREKVDESKDLVETNAKLIEEIVMSIIKPYVADLDDYVKFIQGLLRDHENPPSDVELDDFAMNLSTLIYFASGMCEQLGIRDDISKALYKETYNLARNSQGSGTINDKNTIAELASQHEQLVNVSYNRAYKIVKAKVDSAQEMLASVKKVIGRRMQEIELTKLSRTERREY